MCVCVCVSCACACACACVTFGARRNLVRVRVRGKGQFAINESHIMNEMNFHKALARFEKKCLANSEIADCTTGGEKEKAIHMHDIQKKQHT